jgi:hypothetical protein
MKLAVVNNCLDTVVFDVVAGDDGLKSLEGFLGHGAATRIDVCHQVTSKLLRLGVEGGVAQDGHGVRIIVGGDDGLLEHGCNKCKQLKACTIVCIYLARNCNLIIHGTQIHFS